MTVNRCDGIIGQVLHDPCPNCGHIVVAHQLDGTCAICAAVAEVRAELERHNTATPQEEAAS